MTCGDNKSYADKIIVWRNKGGRMRKRFTQLLLVLLFSFDVPTNTVIEKGVHFPHNGLGSVLHNNSVVRSGAWIYHNVTLGDANHYVGPKTSSTKTMGMIEIKEKATICAGAKVLSGNGNIIIGKGAIVAANAVVTKSVPDFEIWGGVPAKCIGRRNPF